jgi:hypothetical protein
VPWFYIRQIPVVTILELDNLRCGVECLTCLAIRDPYTDGINVRRARWEHTQV